MYRRWARKYLMEERPRFEGHETRAETETAGLMAFSARDLHRPQMNVRLSVDGNHDLS